jgi:chaperonin GroES
MANIQPFGDNVVVSPLDETTQTSSGIYIPDTASKEKPMRGKVIAVGPGKMTESGERMPMDAKVGDEVLFSKYGPTEIELSGEKVLILSNSDIYGVVVA